MEWQVRSRVSFRKGCRHLPRTINAAGSENSAPNSFTARHRKSPAMVFTTFLNTKVSLLLYSPSSKMSPFLNLSIKQTSQIEIYSNVSWAMPHIVSHGPHIFDTVTFISQLISFYIHGLVTKRGGNVDLWILRRHREGSNKIETSKC